MSLLARLFSFNQSGGQEVNATRNKTLTERLIDGEVSISVASGNVTISTTPYDTAQVNYGIIRLTGAPGASRVVTMPDGATGVRTFINATTGGYTITVKTAAGGSVGVALPAGRAVKVYSDGTDCMFVGVVPSRQSYTTSNVSADRTYDANSTTLDEVADLDDTDRGSGGFGSTGR